MTRILIVDDNVQMIEVLRRYALKEGYEVDTATDGIEALSEYQKRKYDLILLDVMMPGRMGLRFANRFAVNRWSRLS